ncbi:MAG: tetratricopeptide repeat protein [Acidobacteria bacterium]|nr:tetratricopeptide repeat protein [Acidobacteriota bacterium]
MKKTGLVQSVSALAIGAILLAGIGCTKGAGKISVTTSSEEARQAYLEGQVLLDNVGVTGARPFFETAVAADPNFALAYLRLAFTQTNPSDFRAQVQKASALADSVSEGERLWIQSVEAANQGNPAKALELLQQLVAAHPNDERAHFLLAGNYFFAQQNLAKAIEEYEKAVAINPEFAAAYNLLGYANRNSGNTAEAEQAFKKYIELLPNNPNPYDSYAEFLLNTGRYDASIDSYQKALSVDPHFVASYIGIATNLNFQGKHKEARGQIQEMFRTARTDGERRLAYLATVTSYVDEGQLGKAVEELGKRYALAEKNGSAIQMAADLNIMGNLLLEAGKVREAQAKYKQAWTLSEESDIPAAAKAAAQRARHANAARVALKKSDVASAKSATEEFRTLAESANIPGQTRLYHQLSGMLALSEKAYDRALEELQQANQQNPRTLFRMALAYQGQGDSENTKVLCERIEGLNQLNSINYSLVRHKAQQLLDSI